MILLFFMTKQLAKKKTSILLSDTIEVLHWRIGGHVGHTPPLGPNSFIFIHIFAEKHPCQRSTPPNGSMPPMGNPGSATVCIFKFIRNCTLVYPKCLLLTHAHLVPLSFKSYDKYQANYVNSKYAKRRIIAAKEKLKWFS